MGTTLRYIVYDLLGSLKQIYTEADIKPFQVLFWVLTHGNQLKAQHILKRDSGAYTTRFDLTVTVDPDTGRHYFELPGQIFDFDGDGAVDYITYGPAVDPDLPAFASVGFSRTSPSKAARLYFRDDERPAPGNPYFYREGNRIYFLGTEQINLTTVEAGLKLTFDPTDLNVDIDAAWDFPEELLPILKIRILDMGRFILQIPKGYEATQMPTQKIQSVNASNLDANNE